MVDGQTDLIKREADLQVSGGSNLPASPIEQVVELAKDPNFDPAKFETMVKFFREERQRDAKIRYNEAIASFQDECPPVTKHEIAKIRTKTGGEFTYKFASYDDIMKIIKQILNKYRISIRFSFPPSSKPNMIRSVLTLSVGAHSEDSEMEMEIPKGTMNVAADMGSARTYIMRYHLTGTLNIVVQGEDKDANVNNKPISENDVNTISALIGDIEDIPGAKFDELKWREYIGINEFTPINEITTDKLNKAVSSLKVKLAKLQEEQ